MAEVLLVSEDPTILNLLADGAQRLKSAIGAAGLADIAQALAGQPVDLAGIRLRGIASLRELLAQTGLLGRIAATHLGAKNRAVRAILFDKTPQTNWSLPWHQDRTIAVTERIEFEGFGPWTVKSGMLHVAPPYDVLARMLTMRVHLDAVPRTNAPLLIAPGSHRLGRIAEADIADVVRRCGSVACLAGAGDIWLYATPILHASEAAVAAGHRRVLQIDFSADELPGGLQWLGV